MKIFKKNKYSILSTVSKYSFVFVIVFSILMPFVFVVADYRCPNGTIVSGNDSTNCPDTSNKNTSDSSNKNNITIGGGIKNPLSPNINDIPSFIKAILQIVLTVGVPIVTLAIIYSGFLFVSAQGNAEKLQKAKDTLLFTLIGAALLLGSWVIANAIKGTVDEIKSTV